MTRPRIALTTGDPNGIGPEVLLKGLADPSLRARFRPLVVGSIDVLARHAERLGGDPLALRVVAAPDDPVADDEVPVLDPAPGLPVRVQFGMIRTEAGLASMQAVERAVRLCLDGTCDAMVTAPISKEAVALAGYGYPGHTEFIAELTGGDPLMMMVSDDLRVGLVTHHLPLRDVPAAITRPAVEEHLRRLDSALRRDFGIEAPRIAVLGLNPHAGDGGVLGREEKDVIAPAMEAARSRGLVVSGPFPADGFFAAGTYRRFDGVLAMYHDQGLVPFKTISFGRGVNCTVGLPIVRTSPDHGTAYDIAGSGTASPDSVRAAIGLAVDIAARRRRAHA
jgi:4-hydroxythreonine-4-phosphate dehydrogenase